jgi:hypothetical protein
MRGTKLLSKVVPAGESADFEPYDSSPAEVATRLNAVPVSFVILDTTAAAHPYKHHAMLQAALAQHPQDWQPVYEASGSGLSLPHTMQVYRNQRDVRGIPIRFEIDLSRKLGTPVIAGSGPGN